MTFSNHYKIPYSCLVAAVMAAAMGTASAQQTITYTNGENSNSSITITSATNPTTLFLSAGTADQLGVINESGTSGDIYKTGGGLLYLTNNNTYSGTTYIDFGTLEVYGAPSFYDVGASIYSPNAYVMAGYNSGDTGTLLINDGGKVTEADGFIGFYSGSTGVATVTGADIPDELANGEVSTLTLSGGVLTTI